MRSGSVASPRRWGSPQSCSKRPSPARPDRRREGYPPDLGTHLAAIHGSKRYDDGVILGPTKPHGAMTGIVLRHGYLVAEWGEPDRVDMTFSITKSFLSTVAGLAWDRGLIRDVHGRVKDDVDDG